MADAAGLNPGDDGYDPTTEENASDNSGGGSNTISPLPAPGTAGGGVDPNSLSYQNLLGTTGLNLPSPADLAATNAAAGSPNGLPVPGLNTNPGANGPGTNAPGTLPPTPSSNSTGGGSPASDFTAQVSAAAANNQIASGPGGSLIGPTAAYMAQGYDLQTASQMAAADLAKTSGMGTGAGAGGTTTGTGTGTGTATGAMSTIFGIDGKPYQIPTDQLNGYNAWLTQYATDQKSIADRTAGQEQQKIDLQKASNDAAAAYQQAMLSYQSQSLAQTAAYQAMQNSIAQQNQELQRERDAQNVTIEREKLDVQRRLLPTTRQYRQGQTVRTM
jgi:hypothetical protein